MYLLKACRRCGGDLAEDDGDWICLQCGAYAYVGLYSQPGLPPIVPPDWPSPADGAGDTFGSFRESGDSSKHLSGQISGQNDPAWPRSDCRVPARFVEQSRGSDSPVRYGGDTGRPERDGGPARQPGL